MGAPSPPWFTPASEARSSICHRRSQSTSASLLQEHHQMNISSYFKTASPANSHPEPATLRPATASNPLDHLTRHLLALASRFEVFGVAITRLGIIIVLFWI